MDEKWIFGGRTWKCEWLRAGRPRDFMTEMQLTHMFEYPLWAESIQSYTLNTAEMQLTWAGDSDENSWKNIPPLRTVKDIQDACNTGTM
jgi:hypothetical protein